MQVISHGHTHTCTYGHTYTHTETFTEGATCLQPQTQIVNWWPTCCFLCSVLRGVVTTAMQIDVVSYEGGVTNIRRDAHACMCVFWTRIVVDWSQEVRRSSYIFSGWTRCKLPRAQKQLQQSQARRRFRIELRTAAWNITTVRRKVRRPVL